jgi:hypothetical protein
MWLHVNFVFDGLTGMELIEFKKLIQGLIKLLEPEYKFYLFEPWPDCFLAMKLDRSERSIKDKVYNYMDKIEHDYICAWWIDFNTKDYENGKDFIGAMKYLTNLALKTNLKQITRIMHCSLNSLWASSEMERDTYYSMLMKCLDKEKGREYGKY